MKRGQELSRTVATFIVQKILLDDNGLSYICQTGERFFAVKSFIIIFVKSSIGLHSFKSYGDRFNFIWKG